MEKIKVGKIKRVYRQFVESELLLNKIEKVSKILKNDDIFFIGNAAATPYVLLEDVDSRNLAQRSKKIVEILEDD